jgi:malate dehydrogenase
VKAWLTPSASGDWVSSANISNGEYGVTKGMVFGYPCTGDGKGNFRVVEGLTLDDFGKAKFALTLKELQEEQDAVKDLLP